MSHRFFVWPTQIDGRTVRFSPGQAHQLRSVLRLRAGDTVRVFDGAATMDRLVRLTGADVGQIQGVVPHATEPRTRVIAYPALLQRDKFEQVLQKLTEVGVGRVVPVVTRRGLIREGPDDRRRARWEAILREAAEQSGRGVVPELGAAMTFDAAVGQAVTAGPTLVAYEAERERSLHQALAFLVWPAGPRDDRSDAIGRKGDGRRAPAVVSLFVGPEGGYAPEEVALAAAHGAALVTLGPRILRAETASPVLAALVLYELGDLSSPHASDDRP